jgi:hypothetical protein
MKFAFAIILATIVATGISAATIKIHTQQDFDLLSETIANAIDKGANDISVDILAKELTFDNNQIFLKGIKRKDVSISIHGKGVHIMSQGQYVDKVNSPDFMYLENSNYYNPWTEFQQLQDTIAIINYPAQLCRIYTPHRNKKESAPQNKFINYTCWYTSRTSPITEIGRRFMDFDGGDWAIAQEPRRLNVNMDYSYAKIYPRYRLFGTKKASGKIYECIASTLLNLAFCDLKSFSIDSIHVKGSSNKGALIFINHCSADSISVSGSSFQCIGGTVLLDRKSTNVCFAANKVDTFMGIGIHSEVESTGAKVIGNIFSNCSLSMEQGFAIQMRSNRFLVKNNTISDFCYGGIGVGIWAGSKTDSECSGEVSGNELFYTSTFLDNLSQYTLMDSGAIYTWTRCHGIVIRYNYIHDISGIKDNRGIFCDDGTKNVTITNNRIERIHNSYDIDLRWCDTFKEMVPDHNTGNTLLDNNTKGKVRFETSKR